MADTNVLQRIREMFPALAYLVNDREVGRLLRDAVDLNKGFSPERFRAELMQTNWWRRHSDSQRQWAAPVRTNPGEAAQQRSLMTYNIRQLASQLGVTLSQNVQAVLRERALQMGLSPDDPLLRSWIISNRSGRRAGTPGEVDRLAGQFMAMSAAYMVPQRNDVNARKWALRVLSGQTTPEAVEEAYRKQAMKRFPWMQQLLQQGVTPEEFFSQHRAIIANELEVSEDQIDFINNPTWSRVINHRDPKTGELRPMTLSEAQTLARSQPKWWNTQRGKAADSNTAAAILQMFGRRSMSSQPQLGGLGLAS